MSPDAILRPKLSKNTSRLQRQAVEILSVCCRSRMRRCARRGAVEAMPSKALPFRPPMVGLGGLEPPTSPLSGVRSNHLSYRPDAFGLRAAGGLEMVEPVGIEPTTPCLQSRCSPS